MFRALTQLIIRRSTS